MPSTTHWTRLEPRCRDAEMTDALQARIADPLWSLARQWQVGEFTGEDAGSPVTARCRAEVTRVDRYHPPSGGGQPYDGRREPLEALVEREPVDLTADRYAAAQAGLHFLRLLRHHGLDHHVDAYVARFPMNLPGDAATDGGGGLLGLVAGRVPDGALLHGDVADLPRGADGTPSELPPEPAIPDDDVPAVATAIGEWLAWFTSVHGPPARTSSWVDERMEHRFGVSAPADGRRIVLEADGYPGGHLDWYAFDVAAEESTDHGAAEEIVRTAIPAAVRYPGMPRSRWWEFEDARTDFGAVDAAPEDLSELLFLEFALVYGNDWFLIPMELDVGSMCRIRSLVVTDTFGTRTLVRSHRAVDGAGAPWRMFDLDRRNGANPGDQLLYLAPTLAASLHGPDLEEVLLRRDEMANLAWAIERVVPGADGTPVRRAEEAPADPPHGDPGGADATYRLSTGVPDHWIPLVPVRDAAGSVRLRRGRVAGADAGRPSGAILGAEDLSLFEEELRRSGAGVTRGYQYARWIDGSTHRWMARRRRERGGEAWSGLRFDVVEPLRPDGPS